MPTVGAEPTVGRLVLVHLGLAQLYPRCGTWNFRVIPKFQTSTVYSSSATSVRCSYIKKKMDFIDATN